MSQLVCCRCFQPFSGRGATVTHHPICGRLVCGACTEDDRKSETIGVCSHPSCLHPIPELQIDVKRFPLALQGLRASALYLSLEYDRTSSNGSEPDAVDNKGQEARRDDVCSSCKIAKANSLKQFLAKSCPICSEVDCTVHARTVLGGDVNLAEAYCIQCRSYYCKDCCQDHDNRLSNHTVLCANAVPAYTKGELGLPHLCSDPIHLTSGESLPAEDVVVIDFQCFRGLCGKCYFDKRHEDHPTVRADNKGFSTLIGAFADALTSKRDPLSKECETETGNGERKGGVSYDYDNDDWPTASLLDRCNRLVQTTAALVTTYNSLRAAGEFVTQKLNEWGGMQGPLMPQVSTAIKLVESNYQPILILLDTVDGLLSQRRVILGTLRYALMRCGIAVDRDDILVSLNRDTILDLLTRDTATPRSMNEIIQMLGVLESLAETLRSGDPSLSMTVNVVETFDITTLSTTLINAFTKASSLLSAGAPTTDCLQALRELAATLSSLGEKVTQSIPKGPSFLDYMHNVAVAARQRSANDKLASIAKSLMDDSGRVYYDNITERMVASINEAIELGSKDALFYKAIMCYPQTKEYFKALTDAEAQGCTFALLWVFLGKAYAEADGVSQDLKKAEVYYTKAVKNNCMLGHVGLSRMWLNGGLSEGTSISPDRTKALDVLLEAENAGVKDGMVYVSIGDKYKLGYGVPRDITKALSYYELAMKVGCPLGYLRKASIYADAIGVPEDIAGAINVLNEAEQKGVANSDIYRAVGNYLRYEPPADEGSDETEEWLQKAINMGGFSAYETLADLHRSPMGRPGGSSDVSATSLLVKAAERGEANGSVLLQLGNAYLKGQGINQDGARALDCYDRALKLYEVTVNKSGTISAIDALIALYTIGCPPIPSDPLQVISLKQKRHTIQREMG